MRTNYVLIDFENVQPKALSALNGEPFKVMVFVGANQTKVSFASLFQKKLSEGEIAALVAELESRGQIAITDTKVTYSLPAA